MGQISSVLLQLPSSTDSLKRRSSRFGRVTSSESPCSAGTAPLKESLEQNTTKPQACREPSRIVFEASASVLEQQPDFRAKYLTKLAHSGAWAPRAQRPAAHQTVTIFDWDDTLLCTSCLLGGQRQNLRPHLKATAHWASQLLAMAQCSGPTFIITNAAEGWVQQSATQYMPELVPMLKKVPIISARSRFEPFFPGKVSEWKTHAFLEVQRQLDSGAIANLISVGDSTFEMDAVHTMGREFSEAVVKTVKMWEKPSAEDVRRQLELVCQEFSRIVDHPSGATIRFCRQ
mmetsp:Transcript_27383/g.91019  ORF Transcript_27383/g.91019 Transcript_27383/m.91019 type:complete len:288 (+) Transcript_27383:80-943(+)